MWFVGRFAWCVSWVRINRVNFQTVDQSDGGGTWVHKQRLPLSGLLAVAGNFVFRLRTVPVVVLPRPTWETWQRKIHQVTGRPGDDRVTLGAGKALLWPLIEGRPLAEIISQRYAKVEEQQTQTTALLGVALGQLYQLHQIEIEIDGTQLRVSHGDASVANVMFDKQTQTMTWFDFDLRHDLWASAEDRHADDLRSFLFTAVESLPSEAFSTHDIDGLLKSIMPAYPKAEVWAALSRIINDRWFGCDLFHQAQLFRLRKGRLKKTTAGLIKQQLD